MQSALVNGIHIHYLLTGRQNTSPLVVFINSLGTDFRIWDRVIDRLGGGVSILRNDKRGHGLSDVTTPPYTVGDHVNDLAGLLARLKVNRTIVCGISVGGMIAMGLAAKRPDMVRGLVLADTGHKIGSAIFWNQRIEQVRKQGIAGIADGVVERWFSKRFRQVKTEEVATWRNMLIRTPVDGYIGTCAALRDTDLTDAAMNLRCPVQCLCGSEDGATPPELVESMSALIRSAHYSSIAGAGHLPCIEAPNEMAAIISNLIEESQS